MAFDIRNLPSPTVMGVAPLRMHLEDGDWVDLKWNGHSFTVTDVVKTGPNQFEGLRSPLHHSQNPQNYVGLPAVGLKVQFQEQNIFVIEPRA